MILIECFEQSPIKNIASCLNLRPQKLIFIGNGEDMQKSVHRYKKFLSNRSINTRIETCDIINMDIVGIAAVLENIVKRGEECIFDLSGGDERVIAAAGMVYERLKQKYPISMQQMNLSDGNVQDCDGDGTVKDIYKPKLTLKELITLYGGCIVPDVPQPSHTYTLSDIANLWDTVAKDSTGWNKKVSVLLEFESRAGVKGEVLDAVINLRNLRNSVSNFPEKRALFDSVINDLRRSGVIKIKSRNETNFSYKYNNILLRRCLKKSGNTLEYKTFLEARELYKNGRPVFNDCLLSVQIDWDGVVHKSVHGGIKDTKNEIDVMLMRGLIPIFISCKNGKVDDAELYKLNTVAERFGGKYAKKVLIATDLDYENQDTELSLIQRARDMNIIIETDAARFTSQDWQDFLLNL